MGNATFYVKLSKIEKTGMYQKVSQVFFCKHLQICYVEVVLHTKTKRCRALLDDFTGLLQIEGMQGSFPESDLRWPANVTIFPTGEVGILYGPEDYDISEIKIENVSFIN